MLVYKGTGKGSPGRSVAKCVYIKGNKPYRVVNLVVGKE